MTHFIITIIEVGPTHDCACILACALVVYNNYYLIHVTNVILYERYCHVTFSHCNPLQV